MSGYGGVMSGQDRVTWHAWTDRYGIVRPRLQVLSPTRELLRSIDVKDIRKKLPATEQSRTRQPGDYAVVAEAWRYFASVSNSPTRDVAEVFGAPYATAAQWIKRARQHGLLEQPTQRREASA